MLPPCNVCTRYDAVYCKEPSDTERDGTFIGSGHRSHTMPNAIPQCRPDSCCLIRQSPVARSTGANDVQQQQQQRPASHGGGVHPSHAQYQLLPAPFRPTNVYGTTMLRIQMPNAPLPPPPDFQAFMRPTLLPDGHKQQHQHLLQHQHQQYQHLAPMLSPPPQQQQHIPPPASFAGQQPRAVIMLQQMGASGPACHQHNVHQQSAATTSSMQLSGNFENNQYRVVQQQQHHPVPMMHHHTATVHGEYGKGEGGSQWFVGQRPDWPSCYLL